MLHDQFRAHRIFSRWRVRPSFGESATTYFATLVADSEDCSPFLFANRAGLMAGWNPSERILEALLRLPLTSEEKDSLVRWTPMRSREAQSWTLGSNVIAGKRFAEVDRACAACIEEAAFHRVWWDCQGFVTCPIHDTPLSKFCRPTNTKYVRFTCHGVARSKITTPPVLSLRGQETYEGYLLSRLGAVEPVGARPMLDDQPLDVVIKTVQFVGRFLSNPWANKRAPPMRSTSMAAGFEALKGDETNLEDHFSKWLVSNVPAEKLPHATLDHYGYFRQMAMEEGVLRSQVFTAKLAACARHGTLIPKLRTRPGVDVPPHPKALAKQALLSRYGIEVLLPLCWPDMPDHRAVTEVPKDVAERVLAVASELVPLTRAAKLLGCSPVSARSVARIFTLDGRPVAVSKKPGDKSELNFIKSELDWMTETIDGLPQPPTEMRTVGLRKYAQHHILGQNRVIVDVLSGRTEAFSGSKHGLDRILFERPPKAGRGGKPVPVGRTHVPVGAMLGCEFTGITGVNSTTANELLNRGFIKGFSGKRGLLDRKVALAFHDRYVNPVRYMMGRGLNLSEAIWALKKMDLPMAFAHSTLRPYFAERKEMEAKIGPLYRPTDQMMKRWRSLIRHGGENCPSFIIPEVPGDGMTNVYTSSRKFSFRVTFEDEGLVLKTSFKPTSTRIWKIYQEHSEIFRLILMSFEWKTDGDETTASVRIATDREIQQATMQLGELTTYFRYKMP